MDQISGPFCFLSRRSLARNRPMPQRNYGRNYFNIKDLLITYSGGQSSSSGGGSQLGGNLFSCAFI